MRKKSVRVAGLDLAAVNSGLCVIDSATCAGYPPIEWTLQGEHAIKGGMQFPTRVTAAQQVMDIIEKAKPDLIALEDYALRMAPNNTSGYQYAEFAGIVKYYLYEAGYPILIIPPTTMRSFLGAKNGGGKEQLINTVYERYGFSSKQPRKGERSNVCDAFAHAYIGSCSYFARDGRLTANLKTQEKVALYGDGKKRLSIVEKQVMKRDDNGSS